MSAGVRYATGDFFNGAKDTYTLFLNMRPSKRFSASLDYKRDDINLPAGSFRAELISTKLQYAFSTRAFFNALIQWDYDTDEFTANLRLNYKYRSRSNIYVVYTERRDLDGGDPADHSLLLKFTYLWSL